MNQRASEAVDQELDLADFEKALAELEGLVERMEGGQLTLADTLRDYEEGIALYRRCQQALQKAELRVQELSAAVETSSDTKSGTAATTGSNAKSSSRAQDPLGFLGPPDGR